MASRVVDSLCFIYRDSLLSCFRVVSVSFGSEDEPRAEKIGSAFVFRDIDSRSVQEAWDTILSLRPLDEYTCCFSLVLLSMMSAISPTNDALPNYSNKRISSLPSRFVFVWSDLRFYFRRSSKKWWL